MAIRLPERVVRVPGQFKGKFDFVARRKGEKRRITAASMPALGISLVCDEQGKWTSVSPAAKPRPRRGRPDFNRRNSTRGSRRDVGPSAPAFAAIGNAELRKQFGINLSTEQSERLRRLARRLGEGLPMGPSHRGLPHAG